MNKKSKILIIALVVITIIGIIIFAVSNKNNSAKDPEMKVKPSGTPNQNVINNLKNRNAETMKNELLERLQKNNLMN